MVDQKRPPTHPGQILKYHYLVPLSLTITVLAKHLDISRKTLSAIINERKSITPDTALRLSRAFNTTPELWLNLQKNYDLWKAAQSSTEWLQIQPIEFQVNE